MIAPPLFPLALALALLAGSVVIHATMLTLLFQWFSKVEVTDDLPFVRGVWLLVRVAWWTVLAHLLEMAIWAIAYVRIGAFPEFVTALYFSSVTYTTVGYGDLLLPAHWHLLAGMEGLTGILMAGWSTGFLFAVISRLLGHADRIRLLNPGPDA